MKKISIIGTGSWGTALGWLLNNNGHQVCMWSPHPEKAEHLKKTRENPRLPGVKDVYKRQPIHRKSFIKNFI